MEWRNDFNRQFIGGVALWYTIADSIIAIVPLVAGEPMSLAALKDILEDPFAEHLGFFTGTDINAFNFAGNILLLVGEEVVDIAMS